TTATGTDGARFLDRCREGRQAGGPISSGDRGVRPTPLQPEFPDQRVGRPAGDAHPTLVDAEEVVGRAERDLVPVVVAPALRGEFDVMALHRSATAALNQAAVPVAREDAVPLRLPLLHVRFPDLNEVRRDLQNARSQ